MIRLTKMTLENRRDIMDLSVSEEQKKYVAPIRACLGTAYILETNGGSPIVFAIYDDETPIGFTLLTYGITSYDLPEIAKSYPCYCILRFMIAEKYQRKGYGRAALAKILEYVRTIPKGPAKFCWLEYVPGNDVAKHLYRSLGFQETGEIVNGEIVTAIEL